MTIFRLADRGAFAGASLTLLNRCRAHGLPGDDDTDGFAIDARLASAADKLDLLGEIAEGLPEVTKSPRIAIYSGEAIGYPYWAYYAHALLSLGLTFTPVDGRQIIAGALSEFDLLVMPGGFATWGLDRAESLSGIDAAIRAFLSEGGAFIGSCGGGFYASDGRPGWLGAIDATPQYTQEYLLTGAGVLGISITDPLLARGLPEAVELAYYHGPFFRMRSARPLRSAISATSFRRAGSSSTILSHPPSLTAR